jgi:hypothetical protein
MPKQKTARKIYYLMLYILNHLMEIDPQVPEENKKRALDRLYQIAAVDLELPPPGGYDE